MSSLGSTSHHSFPYFTPCDFDDPSCSRHSIFSRLEQYWYNIGYRHFIWLNLGIRERFKVDLVYVHFYYVLTS